MVEIEIAIEIGIGIGIDKSTTSIRKAGIPCCIHRTVRDQWLRANRSVPMNIAEDIDKNDFDSDFDSDFDPDSDFDLDKESCHDQAFNI